MTATWTNGVGAASTAAAASTASVTRDGSGHRARAMPHTAWATTATATTFRPCSRPPGMASRNATTPYPKAVNARADGRVKASQAANAPGRPALANPMPMPT